MERLNRYLARSGVASRRGAEDLMAQGRVRVNGVLAPPTGRLVDPGQDLITVDGRPVRRPSPLHLALNKPAGYVTSMNDPRGRPVVADLIPPELRESGLFPVGRLDHDTHGLLLLSNDGELGHRLLHPRHAVEKEYLAHVSPSPTEAECRRLLAGVTLDDGPARALSCTATPTARGVGTVHLAVSVGRNRIVRRMLAAVGLSVLDLQRVRFGTVRLGRLRAGDARRLRPSEVAELRRLVGLEA